MYYHRTIEKFILQANAHFPVLLLTGARQVGKTTLLKHLKEESRTYVTLDDPLLLNSAREDPALFLQRFQPPILIDEIQYAPQLLPHIKMMADETKKPGLFWLTGSQHLLMMKNVSESLAGRVAVLELLGMSRREILKSAQTFTPFLPSRSKIQERAKNQSPLSLQELYALIWRGSFPAIALSETMNRDLFYGSYVQTYLQRDVRSLLNVNDELAFLRFLRAAAARTAQILNVSELAKDADVAPNTAKKWLAILQASGIVFLLEPYYTNVTKRLIKAPKLYFTDTGLCSYLTEWSSPQTLEAGAMSGAILETWVINEIIKSYKHNGRKPPVYYFRDKSKKEIDLLIIENGTVYPIEIKKTSAPDKRLLKNFFALEKLKMSIGEGGVICLSQHYLPLTEQFSAIPISAL